MEDATVNAKLKGQRMGVRVAWVVGTLVAAAYALLAVGCSSDLKGTPAPGDDGMTEGCSGQLVHVPAPTFVAPTHIGL